MKTDCWIQALSLSYHVWGQVNAKCFYTLMVQIARDLTGPTTQIADRTQLSNLKRQPVEAIAVEGLIIHFVFESIRVLRRYAVITGLGVLEDFPHLRVCPSFQGWSKKTTPV